MPDFNFGAGPAGKSLMAGQLAFFLATHLKAEKKQLYVCPAILSATERIKRYNGINTISLKHPHFQTFFEFSSRCDQSCWNLSTTCFRGGLWLKSQLYGSGIHTISKEGILNHLYFFPVFSYFSCIDARIRLSSRKALGNTPFLALGFCLTSACIF